MFVSAQNPDEAISAVKALQKASVVGQRIYHLTPANQSAILANIHLDSDTMTEIRAVPSDTFIARYIPVEFDCPTPVPCVPGLINAESRVPFRKRQGQALHLT